MVLEPGFPTHLVHNKWVEQPGLHLTHCDWVAQVAARKILRTARQAVNVSQLASWLAVIYTRNRISPPLFTLLKVQNLQLKYSRASGSFHKEFLHGAKSFHHCSRLSATELKVASKFEGRQNRLSSMSWSSNSQSMNDSSNYTKRIK